MSAEEVTLTVEGMSCEGCAGSVKSALSRVPGVAGVEVDLKGKKAVIRGAALSRPVLVSAVEAAGYDVPPG